MSANTKSSGKTADGSRGATNKRKKKSTAQSASDPQEAPANSGLVESDNADLLVQDAIEDEEDEFSESDSDAELSDDLDEFDGVEGEEDEAIEVVEALSAKEQNARSLEVRRAIEERMDQRRLDQDLDYLDTDIDD